MVVSRRVSEAGIASPLRTFCRLVNKNESCFCQYLMSVLPVELWSLIASANIQTYHVLVQVVKGLCEVCPVGATSWEDYFAMIYVDMCGYRRWELHGRLHRGGDKPAVVHTNGYQAWYQYGLLHRSNDKPTIIYADGSQVWYHNGEIHRGDDKPAIIWADGMQAWYQHGKIHRYDKPAVIYADGRQEWWLNGKHIK